jgi:hypothetical protein
MAKNTTDTTPPVKVKVTTGVIQVDVVASRQTTQTTPPIRTTSTKGDKK